MKNQKTIKALYAKFCGLYTPRQIERSNELMKLYQYLSNMVKLLNGNYIHVADEEMCDLIFRYLGEIVEGENLFDDMKIFKPDVPVSI
jgi:hypothetical protein